MSFTAMHIIWIGRDLGVVFINFSTVILSTLGLTYTVSQKKTSKIILQNNFACFFVLHIIPVLKKIHKDSQSVTPSRRGIALLL